MTEPNLLPCPFCGSDKIEITEAFNNGGWLDDYGICCSNCSCQLNESFHVSEKQMDIKKTLIEKWNQRFKLDKREG